MRDSSALGYFCPVSGERRENPAGMVVGPCCAADYRKIWSNDDGFIAEIGIDCAGSSTLVYFGLGSISTCSGRNGALLSSKSSAI